MNKRDTKRLRKLLEAQRDDLLGDLVASQDGRVDAEPELDPDDLADEIDAAASQANRSFNGRLMERRRGLLRKIEVALEKIEQGSYGECASCGEAISVKRLEARPVAELCIECKSEQERRESR